MTRKILAIGLPLLLVFAGLLWATETLKVTVKSSRLRKSPKFYSGSLATVQFGESLKKVTEQGDWIQAVTTTGIKGWIHSSAVAKPTFSLTADRKAQEETAADEVALAGKGFNEQVEKEYRKTANLDYTWVDLMAQITVTEMEMERFLRDGKLGEFGGDQ